LASNGSGGCQELGGPWLQPNSREAWAGEGACPSATSRVPVFGVHWSEAETLARKKQADQAQGLVRKGMAIAGVGKSRGKRRCGFLRKSHFRMNPEES